MRSSALPNRVVWERPTPSVWGKGLIRSSTAAAAAGVSSDRRGSVVVCCTAASYDFWWLESRRGRYRYVHDSARDS
jgi:hypothetical protein